MAWVYSDSFLSPRRLLLGLPDLHSIIEETEDFLIGFAFRRHGLRSVLAHADSVSVSASIDMEGGDIIIIHALVLDGYIGALS